MYRKLIEEYIPVNEQELLDKEAMLTFISRNEDALLRSNLTAHFTSSAIVLNQEMNKVLFIHHNIYNSWGWVGGHNDGNPDFLKVAIMEAMEETGVKTIHPYTDKVIGIDTIYVPNHYKNGQYITDHLHMNLTFLLIADDTEELVIKEDENSGVKWFSLEEALDIMEEPRMRPIYEKLFYYVRGLKK